MKFQGKSSLCDSGENSLEAWTIVGDRGFQTCLRSLALSPGGEVEER